MREKAQQKKNFSQNQKVLCYDRRGNPQKTEVNQNMQNNLRKFQSLFENRISFNAFREKSPTSAHII